jgi:sugar lactone lactonase YvrE
MTSVQAAGAVAAGYTPDPEWLRLPRFWDLGLASDVAVDAQDRVWLGSRGDHPVSAWSPDGELIGLWGKTDLESVHGISTGPDGAIWVADCQLHVIRRYDERGTVQLELGTPGRGKPAVTHLGQFGEPFNMPTSAAVDAQGRIFVADGYGNRRVHRFSPDGELEISWGRGGVGPGEFSMVHHVSVDEQGRILVSDRENDRVQFFSPDGEFLTEWTGLLAPGATASRDGVVYVAEMGKPLNTQPNGVSARDADGTALATWYADDAGAPAGSHGLALDSQGSIYIADIRGRRVIKLARRS